jgi:hypothetical protein
MHCFRSIVVLVAFFVYPYKVNGVDVFRVHTQEQFDLAIERINRGEDLQLHLLAQHYVLNRGIIAKSPLTIIGNGATIMCYSDYYTPNDVYKTTDSHYVYRQNNRLSIFPLFFDDKGLLFRVSESVVDSIGVNHVEGDIIASKQFSSGAQLQIPIPNNLIHLKNRVFSNAYGYFDCGWQVINFRLFRSDSKFFYCVTLNSCSTNNYQFDKKVYKKPIRFVVFNAELKDDSIYFDNEFVFVPKNVGSLYCLNRDEIYRHKPTISVQSDFVLEGVRFLGFDGIRVELGAINKCIIKDCHFRNSIGSALIIYKKGGENAAVACVDNCRFISCAIHNDNCLKIYGSIGGKPCVQLSNCMIMRYGDERIYYKNSVGAVFVDGDVSLINNTMINSPRGQLFLNRGRILVEGNVFLNSDQFNAYYERNLSSDMGMVYCNHLFKDTNLALSNISNRILISRNLIYGAYSYGNYARGIYIDDGRGDVECKRNIILNTQSYSIDSRNVSLTEASSARNLYCGNIVTSCYQLVAGPAVSGKDSPITSGNILFDTRQNVTNGVVVMKMDSRYEQDEECYFHDGKIKVTRGLYKKIRRSPAWHSVGRFIEKK